MGDVPEWLAAIGTVSAFGATLWVITRDQRTRSAQHLEEMHDEALLVKVTYGPVRGEAIPLPDVPAETDVGVSITNCGRRSIENVRTEVVAASNGERQGERTTELIAPGRAWTPQFPATNAVWNTLAYATDDVDVQVATWFDDIDGTHWRKDPNGDVRRLRTGSKG